MSKEPSLASVAMIRAFMFAMLIIPTGITIFIALEVKNVSTLANHAVNGEPQVICFEPTVCAIEVHNKWYKIDGVIIMDEVVPEQYKLHDLIEDAMIEQKIELNKID